jgi:hypothetical protein
MERYTKIIEKLQALLTARMFNFMIYVKYWILEAVVELL